MYPLSFVEEMAAGFPLALDLYMLNPLAVILTGYRALVLPDATFAWSPFAVAGTIGPVFLLVAAYAMFRRAQRNFADML